MGPKKTLTAEGRRRELAAQVGVVEKQLAGSEQVTDITRQEITSQLAAGNVGGARTALEQAVQGAGVFGVRQARADEQKRRRDQPGRRQTILTSRLSTGSALTS